MAKTDAALLSKRWQRACRALDGGLRVAYLRTELASRGLDVVAPALDDVCAAAEQAEPDAREMLVAVVDLLAEKEQGGLAQRLREEAAGRSLLALGRLLRRPVTSPSRAPPPPSRAPPPASSADARVPDYGTGRTLTLGERRALARRPTRKAMEKLFADPHPMVIRTLLANPKVVEDDVVRLAARRPVDPDVLAEVARSPRWAHRVRVRMAIVLNPDTPVELSIPLLTLLVRPELELVSGAPSLIPTLRAAALDLLERRPPPRKSSARARLQ